jgi:hypothetical protein
VRRKDASGFVSQSTTSRGSRSSPVSLSILIHADFIRSIGAATAVALATSMMPAVQSLLCCAVWPQTRPQANGGLGDSVMFKRSLFVGPLALALMLASIPASAQSDRRAAAEAYARVVDYPLLVEKAASRRAAELPASEREAFIAFTTRNVDFEMTRFYAISAMVDLFEASELQALASFAATPEGRSALAKLPALGAILTPIVERQIADAERRFRAR